MCILGVVLSPPSAAWPCDVCVTQPCDADVFSRKFLGGHRSRITSTFEWTIEYCYHYATRVSIPSG